MLLCCDLWYFACHRYTVKSCMFSYLTRYSGCFCIITELGSGCFICRVAALVSCCCFVHCSNCYCFRARPVVVSVVFCIVPLNGNELFMWGLTRAPTSPKKADDPSKRAVLFCLRVECGVRYGALSRVAKNHHKIWTELNFIFEFCVITLSRVAWLTRLALNQMDSIL